MSDQTQNSHEKTPEELEAECKAVCERKSQEIQKIVDEQNTN
jgi:hypothetical protein